MSDPRKHLFANNATGRLASSITVDSDQIQLQEGQGARFPAVAVDDDEIFKITVENLLTGEREIMHVTDNTDDFFVVERAQEGTEALEFTAGPNVIVSHRLTAETLDYLRDKSSGGSGAGLTLVEQPDSYDFVIEDANTGVVNPKDNGANLYFIPAHEDVPFDVGTFLVVVNRDVFKTVAVITGAEIINSATGVPGSVAIAGRGMATFVQVEIDEWFCIGTGVS